MFTRHGFFLTESIGFLYNMLLNYKIFYYFTEKTIMQKNNFMLLFICSAVLISCDFKCSIGEDKKASAEGKNVSSSIKTENGAVISNGINITSSGVKLKSATLQLEDGKRVPDDNMVGLNEKIIMIIELDSTWTIENEEKT